MGPDHINYEVTIEDPKVFTRPWKMSMPLYRRKEPTLGSLSTPASVFFKKNCSRESDAWCALVSEERRGRWINESRAGRR